MRAAVYYTVGDLRVEDVDEPSVGPGQVKLKVEYNGLCGTDLHEVYDSQRAVPSYPHPLTGAMAPLIIGHEIGGTVVEVGRGVTDVAPGALVSVEPLATCNACESCQAGDRNLCDRLAFHGLSTGGGGLAEFTVVPRSMVHFVPDGVTSMGASLAEPLAVAYHAVEVSGVRNGQSAAVLGGGPIGIGIYLSLLARGIDATVVEPYLERRQILSAIGATALDPIAGPLVEQLRDATGRGGVEVCFETSGTVASLESALTSTLKHGVVVLLASPRQPLPPVLGTALAKELQIRASYAYRGEFPAVLAAISSGAYQFEGWVTTAAMSSLHHAMDEIRAGRASKILIDPST